MTDLAPGRHLTVATVHDDDDDREPPPYDPGPADWTPPATRNSHNGHNPASTPPSDLDAERDVLGGILHNPATLEHVTLILEPRDFHRPTHELIYDAILALYARTRPVDITTVANQLAADLKTIGGRTTLEELHLRGTSIIDPAYHAEIVRDVATRRRLDTAGDRLKQLARTHGDTTTLELLDAATTELAAIPRTVPGVENATTSSWAPVDLAGIIANGEILEQPTELARTDGQCLLYPSAVHSISGEPESGKTWVALIAAAQVLRHTPDGHVTYVDFEDRAGRVVPRLVNLGAPPQAIIERFHYIRPSQALDAAGRKLLDQCATQSSLAVIDGVTEAMTMHGLSLLDNEDAARYLDLLPRHLADQGPAVLQIDHVVKDSEKQGRWAIGAGHKLAGLDGAAYGVKVLEPFGRGKIGRAAIAVHKDRPGAVREIALGNAVAHLVIDSRGESMAAWLEEPSSMPKSADGAGRPTHLMEKVSRFVEAYPGASQTEIEKGVTGKVPYIRLAVRALIEEGYLTATAGTRNSHNHSVIAVFREDESDES